MVHLLVYGSSIFLASVSTQLETLPAVQVLPCRSLSEVGNLGIVDAIVIDLNDPTSADALRLWRARPDLRLIGMNGATGTLTVMSGEVYFTPSFDEIIARLRGMVQP